MNKNLAIFFDRDGVLIEAPVIGGMPKSSQKLCEISLCENILNFCNQYKRKYKLIMITNQPDVTRGINTKENILEINSFIKKKLSLDDVYVCYSDDENCFDRKPNPGMLIKAGKKFQIDPENSYFIGDRWRDIIAGKAYGCKTIFLDRGYNEKLETLPDYRVENIKEIFDIIEK